MDGFFQFLPHAFSLWNLTIIVVGTLGGLILGASPGLSPTMAVALLVPFTFYMDAASGLILLGAVYTGTGGDIWVSRPTTDGYSAPETLGDPIATDRREGHPCIAPDESFLIYWIQDEEDHRSSCLHISFKNAGGQWSDPIRLETGGKPLHGMCPILSPDGRYLFFNGRRNVTNDIYWVEIGSVIDSLKRRGH